MSRIVLLAGDGPSSWVVARALQQRFDDVRVVVEASEARSSFLKRRIRKLGLWTVMGQILFVAFGKLLAIRARTRRHAILAAGGLSDQPLREAQITRVSSVNATETTVLLQAMAPAVVVVNGTRIIASRVLESVSAPFINMHAGITPTYRGVHGGYWALVNEDRAHCGVTVHLVDPGVDTGEILYQQLIEPGIEDDFFTYTALQLAAGMPWLLRAVEDALCGKLQPRRSDALSVLRTHPTLLEYLWNGWRKGVW